MMIQPDGYTLKFDISCSIFCGLFFVVGGIRARPWKCVEDSLPLDAGRG